MASCDSAIASSATDKKNRVENNGKNTSTLNGQAGFETRKREQIKRGISNTGTRKKIIEDI